MREIDAETLSRRMQNLISSLERVAVRITRMISGSRDFQTGIQMHRNAMFM